MRGEKIIIVAEPVSPITNEMLELAYKNILDMLKNQENK